MIDAVARLFGGGWREQVKRFRSIPPTIKSLVSSAGSEYPPITNTRNEIVQAKNRRRAVDNRIGFRRDAIEMRGNEAGERAPSALLTHGWIAKGRRSFLEGQ